jgi:hypothetical protein
VILRFDPDLNQPYAALAKQSSNSLTKTTQTGEDRSWPHRSYGGLRTQITGHFSDAYSCRGEQRSLSCIQAFGSSTDLKKAKILLFYSRTVVCSFCYTLQYSVHEPQSDPLYGASPRQVLSSSLTVISAPFPLVLVVLAASCSEVHVAGLYWWWVRQGCVSLERRSRLPWVHYLASRPGQPGCHLHTCDCQN